MIKAGIIGATGYVGEELCRLLLSHPLCEIAAVSSLSFMGQKLSDVYPNLYTLCDMTLTDEDEVIQKSDVIFASLPHGLCERIGEKCVGAGKKLIDLGADFRLTDERDYTEWYGLSYQNKPLHEKAVYCIPELHRKRLEDCQIVGNPGCYPTSIALGLAPILKSGKADCSHIIIDSKSGVTGAGRKMTQNTHYPECNEAFSPYKAACHRHTPEIEQTASELAGRPVKVTFVPHLLPVNRGIVSTIYVNLTETMDDNEIDALYRDFYRDERFVRILPKGSYVNLRSVTYSNYCDISLHPDRRTGSLVIASTIDNMVKGAAGQAIQNMNLLFGIPEHTGIDMAPPAF